MLGPKTLFHVKQWPELASVIGAEGSIYPRRLSSPLAFASTNIQTRRPIGNAGYLSVGLHNTLIHAKESATHMAQGNFRRYDQWFSLPKENETQRESSRCRGRPPKSRQLSCVLVVGKRRH